MNLISWFLEGWNVIRMWKKKFKFIKEVPICENEINLEKRITIYLFYTYLEIMGKFEINQTFVYERATLVFGWRGPVFTSYCPLVLC